VVSRERELADHLYDLECAVGLLTVCVVLNIVATLTAFVVVLTR
jgi:hypothetical protein